MKTLVAVCLMLLSSTMLLGTATPAQETASVALRDVIVILRDQMPNLPAIRGARAARAAALAAAQVPIVSHLQASGATHIHGFSLINAVAASVSEAEAERLAAHPLVKAVAPVVTIKLPRLTEANSPRGSSRETAAPTASEASSVLCNTLEPEALELTHTAYSDVNQPQAQRVRDGNGRFVTGEGVKVAFIADGLDTTITGFTHSDGTPVFFDYQDFSGDPAGTPTGGDEAFGDASSIAAQDTPGGEPLLFDISKVVNAAHPLPSPCNIRIRGMAPGASLAGLKVFSSIGVTTMTVFVQAIEWAVLHDDVDVLNESFGNNPFPDNDNDPVSLADRAAVAGGVTVVVSSGDSGYNGTMGAPSTDPYVISAGATTQFRFYAQAGFGVAPFATGGWISNNISAFSSGGFSMSGPRTPDIVAPGDQGWALCSTNTTLYTSCTNFASTPAPAPIETFGGTSESSPLTAGEAALVIQAYRSTHHGADPAPALVKQIIMSTATDLGAPPTEQGAGLINAYAAVNAALSIADQNGQPHATGTSLVNSPTSASIVDLPNAPETLSFAITNTGASEQHLAPTLETLGPPIAGATLTLTLDPAVDPTFPNLFGALRSYVKQQFDVPAGAQHLDAAIAWQAPFSGPAVIAYIGLLDPSGRNAAYSIPQGFTSGYGHVDVVNPVPGTWTAIIFTRAPGLTGSYTGPVQFSWAAEHYVTFGSVAPASLDLQPGATEQVTATFPMPAQPGDQGVAIRFAPSEAGSISHSDIPIALRTLIPIGPGGGTFSGTLTGGNGRDATGPTQTYAFDVPPGINNMGVSLQVPDNLYLLEGLLIDPNGMQLSVEPNVDANGNPVFAMQLERAYPQPGRWRFILLLNYFTSGKQTSLSFTAQIGFNTALVTAQGLPNDAGIKLSASGPALMVPINITNNGGLATAYFADARLQGLTALPLGTFSACAPFTKLPFACFGAVPPTQVRSVQFLAQAKAPITMDAMGNTGYIVGGTGAPDVAAQPVGPNTVAASLAEPEVPWGEWLLYPTLIGPFGPGGAPSTPVGTSVLALLKPFDAAVSSDYGDHWSDVTFGTSTYTTGLVLEPGATGTIHMTIKPNPSLVGTTIRGFVYIDTFNPTVLTGDEVYRIPYSYTVTK